VTETVGEEGGGTTEWRLVSKRMITGLLMVVLVVVVLVDTARDNVTLDLGVGRKGESDSDLR